MPFLLRRDPPIREAALRALLDEVEEACKAALHRRAVSDRIHDGRTACKRIRAALRLLRSAEPELAKREDAWFRDSARALSPQRDADALLGGYDRLRLRFGAELAGKDFLPLRKRLVAWRSALFSRGRAEPALKIFADRMREAGRRLREVRVRPFGFDVFAAACSREYRAARRAMRAADAGRTDGDLHRWRRHAKRHSYQFEFLVEAWPPLMRRMNREVRTLGDLLGEDRDLALLRKSLRGDGARGLPAGPVRALRAVVKVRRAEIQSQALELGARIFADKPRTVARRLSAWWRAGSRPGGPLKRPQEARIASTAL